jgi:tetratricopeptide (TPR) repeat protein
MRFHWVNFLFLFALSLLRGPAAFAQPAEPSPQDLYYRAVTFFNSQDYNSALPLFNLVIQSDPSNYLAYYYLGTCQGKTGDVKDQVLNYDLSDHLHPYPALKAYADKLINNLPIEDQEWVESHLAQTPATPTPEPLQPLGPAKDTGFGVRFSTSLSLYNLADLNTEIGFVQQEVQGWEAANPGDGYQTQTSLSTTDIGFEINPFLPIGSQMEAGFSFTAWPAAAGASYEITAGNAPSYFVRSQWSLSTFSLDLKGRAYIGEPAVRGIRFFVEPSLGIQPINVQLFKTYQDTTDTPSSNQVGYNVSAVGANAALKLGAVFMPAPHAQVSLSAGWQYAAAAGFNGTYSDSGVPAMNGAAGSVQMYTNPATHQQYLFFMPSDTAQYTNFGVNSQTQNYSRALNIDFGGLILSLDASYSF